MMIALCDAILKFNFTYGRKEFLPLGSLWQRKIL